jgi:hypothetical protein
MSAEIVQFLRQATAHEDAAARHDGRYEAQMKAAGASAYAAFCLALKAAPDFQGRQITDQAVLRIYQSPKPRPWWDEHLKAARLEDKAGKADRERAARLIQWHVDPDGATQRRAQHTLRLVAGRKKLSKQQSGLTHGARAPRAPSRAEARTVTAAATTRALAGRELPPAGGKREEDLRAAVLALLGRLQSKARRAPVTALNDAADVLEAIERDFDEALKQGAE